MPAERDQDKTRRYSDMCRLRTPTSRACSCKQDEVRGCFAKCCPNTKTGRAGARHKTWGCSDKSRPSAKAGIACSC
jgi:hypothetical protein